MQLTRPLRDQGIAVVFLLLLGVALTAADSAAVDPTPAADQPTTELAGNDLFAPTVQREPGRLVVKLAAYNQTDSGGIEEVDEDASVFETIIFAEKPLTDTGSLNVRLIGDIVSAASIDRDHNANWNALQSGASGNYRVGAAVGWSEQRGDLGLHGAVSFAKEYAYTSLGLGAGTAYSWNDGATNVSADLQVYADTVQKIRFNGIDEGDEGRDTYTGTVSLTQFLTPESQLAATVSQTLQDGFLQTSYQSVFVDGIEQSEELPDSRSRTSMTLRYKHAIGDRDAIEGGARYYTDDWGVSATTAELRYFYHIQEGRILFEPTYRLHLQSEADYYQPSFSTLPEYRTSDPDLGDFTGHLIGLKTTFFDRRVFGWRGDIDVTAEYYTRDNGLDMFWLIFGYHMDL